MVWCRISQPHVANLLAYQNGGLKTLDDWANVLYGDEWQVSNPRGTAPGIMTNYTQDLLFSMERLSQNPYPLRLVDPSEELPFTIDDSMANEITGTTLEELKSSGSLFYVDRKQRCLNQSAEDADSSKTATRRTMRRPQLSPSAMEPLAQHTSTSTLSPKTSCLWQSRPTLEATSCTLLLILRRIGCSPR